MTDTVSAVGSLHDIAAADWDALAGDSPWLSHALLSALEDSGAVGGHSGWRPAHLALWRDGQLLAAAPRYLKTHSRGEYVFDWAWARAYAQHGLRYYPKQLCAVPFSPIPGPRLLAGDAASRATLAQALAAEQDGVSGCHVLFAQQADRAALLDAGFALRLGVQFHWFNQGWPDFAAFLAALRQDKRKKIRQERNKVARAGVTVRTLVGREIGEADWAFFERCYRHTYHTHGGEPYLPLSFFLQLGERLPQCCVLFIAERHGAPIAASLCLRDAERLYGRYWGALEEVDCLHFELCYYAGIEYALAERLAVFEGGAQGEHKLARGFTPVETCSLHRLQSPMFQQAISRWLAEEAQAVRGWIDEQSAAGPFKSCSQNPPGLVV